MSSMTPTPSSVATPSTQLLNHNERTDRRCLPALKFVLCFFLFVILSVVHAVPVVLLFIIGAPARLFQCLSAETYAVVYSRLLFLPSLFWNLTLHYLMPASRRWYDRVDDYIIMGGLPLRWHIGTLMTHEGVGAAVSLNESWELGCGGSPDWSATGIPYLHLPCIDHFNAPTSVDIQRALLFIRSQNERRVTTYIHCKAGRGRSCTITMCWLMYSRGWSFEETHDYVVRCRPQIKLGNAQLVAVREFGTYLSAHGGSLSLTGSSANTSLIGAGAGGGMSSPSFQSMSDAIAAMQKSQQLAASAANNNNTNDQSVASNDAPSNMSKHFRKPSSNGLSDLVVDLS